MRLDRILVPLDGSHLAEASLPVAEALARRLGSELVLTHALERHAPTAVHGEPHLASFAGARAYLERHRAQLAALGAAAEIHLAREPTADVAAAIDGLAREVGADVVTMCAHGRRTLRGRLVGRIAQRVLRCGTTPILLRTAGAEPDVPFALHRILLPVDFEHDLAAALDAVRRLARAFDAAVTVLTAVERPADVGAWLLPGTAAAGRAFRHDDAARRLDALARGLRDDGIAVDAVVRDEEPDDAIVAEARRRRADVTVVVTHGRTGVAAWYEGSIGQRLVSERGIALLLLRQPPGDDPAAHG